MHSVKFCTHEKIIVLYTSAVFFNKGHHKFKFGMYSYRYANVIAHLHLKL